MTNRFAQKEEHFIYGHSQKNDKHILQVYILVTFWSSLAKVFIYVQA